MSSRININILSETSRLKSVILHTPGPEVENMTPQNAERALYSDILNLAIVSEEYAQLEGILSRYCQVYQVKNLLRETLENEKIKHNFVRRVCMHENTPHLESVLMQMNAEELTRSMFEGVEMEKTTLTRFLDKERYEIRPLHNFFFTRDSAICIGSQVLIGRMANQVRVREALIMETIYAFHPGFETQIINCSSSLHNAQDITFEGGDILVASPDTLIIGMGVRTTSRGIDYIMECLRSKPRIKHILVQELPHTPESFIHLDMVFTLLSPNECMIYEPVILNENRYATIHVEIENGKVKRIREEHNLLTALHKLGLELETIKCGGDGDPYTMEREQWHSGTNFFALDHGKVIGYHRNTYTLDAMARKGYQIIKAKDVLKERVNPEDYRKYVITIEGSELPRGGGGARCMTQPLCRENSEKI